MRLRHRAGKEGACEHVFHFVKYQERLVAAEQRLRYLRLAQPRLAVERIAVVILAQRRKAGHGEFACKCCGKLAFAGAWRAIEQYVHPALFTGKSMAQVVQQGFAQRADMGEIVPDERGVFHR